MAYYSFVNLVEPRWKSPFGPASTRP